MTQPGAQAFTRATYRLTDGQRGLQQVSSTPLPSPLRALASPAPRTDAQKIADTIAAETGH